MVRSAPIAETLFSAFSIVRLRLNTQISWIDHRPLPTIYNVDPSEGLIVFDQWCEQNMFSLWKKPLTLPTRS
jgi:hypothetical protein